MFKAENNLASRKSFTWVGSDDTPGGTSSLGITVDGLLPLIDCILLDGEAMLLTPEMDMLLFRFFEMSIYI